MARRLVVVSDGLSASAQAEICSINGVDVTICAGTLAMLRRVLHGAAGLIDCPRSLFSDALLEIAGPSLRWVHTSGAGCEQFLTPVVAARRIIVTHGRIVHGPEVADHALALVLALARNLHDHIAGRRVSAIPIELRGKKALIVGLGGIGMLIAERLAACGMRILAIDPDLKPLVSFVESVDPPSRLRDRLPDADLVVVTAPLTPESNYAFSDGEFAQMRPSALFVNVSRGAVVDTEALTLALVAGRLRAAALDVTDPEPLPASHQLRTMNNVILTPHVAGQSDGVRARVDALLLENVRRFAAGGQLQNAVSVQDLA